MNFIRANYQEPGPFQNMAHQYIPDHDLRHMRPFSPQTQQGDMGHTIYRTSDPTQCSTCIDQQAPVYGPPGTPSMYPSYPVQTSFENRKKWTDEFSNPFAANQQKQHQPADTTPKLPTSALGCDIVSSGDDQYFRRGLNLNRWFNEDQGEIYIQPPKSMEKTNVGQYGDNLFKTQVDNAENLISTGVMVNPYTGEMFETFENAMPPPTTDKSLPRRSFEVVNPHLIRMQGGYNHHAPPQKRKEICQDVPGVDHGPNVWGTQLYADPIRERMADYAARQLFNNRNGDYSTPQSLHGEKPAGMVGLNYVIRPLPYMPPTNELDNQGYLSTPTWQNPTGGIVPSDLFIRKVDHGEVNYTPQVDGTTQNNGAAYTVGEYELKPTQKPQHETFLTGSIQVPETHQYVVSQTEVKPTLKQYRELALPTGPQQNQIVESGGGQYVVSQTEVKPTLKQYRELALPTGAQQNHIMETGGGQYVVSQTEVKPTMKQYRELSLPTGAQQNHIMETGGGQYVVSQTEVKPTLKQYRELSLPTGAQQNHIMETGGGQYVVSQTEVKPTLKQYRELSLPTGAQQNHIMETGGGQYVVTQTEVKPTLKQYRELSLPTGAQQNHIMETGGGQYVVTQTEVKPTMKQYRELSLPTGAQQNHIMETGGGQYVVTQTEVKPTLKQYRELSLPTGAQQNHIMETGGGGYVVTQTEVKPTLKQYRELSLPTGAQQNQINETGGGAYVVTQTEVKPTLKQYRELSLPTGAQQNQINETGGGAYVVTQTTLRPTLKQFMEQMISRPNIEPTQEPNGNGGWIGFQGDLPQTARQFLEHIAPMTGGIDYNETQMGRNVGIGDVTIRSHRGQQDMYRPEWNKVYDETKDSSVRILSFNDRETRKREGGVFTPLSDLSTYQSTQERWIAEQQHRDNFENKQMGSTNWMLHGVAAPISGIQ